MWAWLKLFDRGERALRALQTVERIKSHKALYYQIRRRILRAANEGDRLRLSYREMDEIARIFRLLDHAD